MLFFDIFGYQDYSFSLKDGRYVLKILMPGVTKEQCSVSVLGSKLSVSDGHDKWSIELPRQCDIESLDAKLDLGILTITCGQKAQDGRKIEVS